MKQLLQALMVLYVSVVHRMEVEDMKEKMEMGCSTAEMASD